MIQLQTQNFNRNMGSNNSNPHFPASQSVNPSVINQSRFIQNVYDIVSGYIVSKKQFTTIDVGNSLKKLNEYKTVTFNLEVVSMATHTLYELGLEDFKVKYNFLARNNHILYFPFNEFQLPETLSKNYNFTTGIKSVLWFSHESKNSELYVELIKPEQHFKETRIYKGVDTRTYIRFLESGYQKKLAPDMNTVDEFFFTNIEKQFESVLVKTETI